MPSVTSSSGVLVPSRVGSQVIHLRSRLVVGIRLHGTIAAPNPRSPTHLKARPFLRYFGETLRRLQCDVTIFAPVASHTDSRHLAQLADSQFPCNYRVVHDPTAGLSGESAVRARRGGGASRSNFQDCLSDLAAEQKTRASRVLFVDSEVNYRFSPAQTIVLEAFRPQRTRSERPRDAEGPNAHTANLDAEHKWMQRRAERPFAANESSEALRDFPVNGHSHSHRYGNNHHNRGAVREAALAIRREDFTLVALAGMLVELAASDVPVADYLRVEPLVEKLSVPFHGMVNYLPTENCDDMEQWDWDAVKVEDAVRGEEELEKAVPDVQERDEHQGLFK